MTKVDTWLDGNDIYVDNDGKYYICYYGEIVSPPFATLQDAWKNGWKYKKKEQQ